MSNLNHRRKKLHITQAMMASKLGIGVSTYCMYENGRRHVPKELASEIASILGVDVDDIFSPSLYKAIAEND